MTSEDRAQVSAVLDRFATGWRNADTEVLKNIWDREYPDSSYIASEKDSALFGHSAIAEYYDNALATFPITSMEISNVKMSGMDTLAHAFCDIAIGFQMNNQEHLVHPRATFVLRKRGGEWRVVHYHESIKWEFPA